MAISEQDQNAAHSPHRRALILSGLTGAAIAGLPYLPQARAATMPFTLDAFITLSSQLTHRPASSLNREMAQRIVDAFLAQGKQHELTALVRDPSAQTPLATELRAAWFSGLSPEPDTAPLGYQHALVWSAAAFLHVPGQCGGATGYWAQPPS